MSSINLLPNKFKEDIAQTKKNKVSFSYFIKTLFLLLLATLIVTGAYFYLSFQASGTKEALEEESKKIEAYGNLENEARLVAERLTTISKIEGDINYWSTTLEEIQKVMPSEASLSSINMDSDAKNRSQITGFATSKDVVATLRNSMEQSDKFEFVDIDSSNIVFNPDFEKNVENFVISFSLTKEALSE